MLWAVLIPHLTVSAVLIGLVFRALRRYRRTVDTLISRAKEADAADQRAFDAALAETKQAMRARVDAAIAEAEKGYGASLPPIIGTTNIMLGAVTASAMGTASAHQSPEIPTEAEIRELPRWAQVAFAARCARRVLPLTALDGNHLSPQTKAILVAAVEFAEAWSVAEGDERRQIDLRFPNLLLVLKGLVTEAITSAVTSSVTSAVSEAYRQGGTFSAAAFAVAAFPFGDLRSVIRDDFQLIRKLTEEHAWNGSTLAPPSIFGPLWPADTPEGWPAPEVLVSELVFEFDVPDEMTTADAIEIAKELSAVLCELHLAGGGHGLAIQPPVEFTAPVRVRVPV